MIFRQATPHDLPTIYEILEGAIRRLGAMGVDQWQHGYPNRERIAQDVEKTVATVAYESGFSSPQYFSNVFRKRYHMTPQRVAKKPFDQKMQLKNRK